MNSDLIDAVAVQSNGDILAVGTTLNKTTGNTELALERYLGQSRSRLRADLAEGSRRLGVSPNRPRPDDLATL